MGFFFASNKREPRAAKKPSGDPRNVTNKIKQSAETLNRLGCKVCPLAKLNGPEVEPYVPKRADILFLGARPTGLEDPEDKLRPFSGKDGAVLKEVIPDKHRKRCAFATTVRRAPNGKDQPEWAAIECCRGHVTRTIEKLRPKVIVGLGPAALHWVLGSNDQIGLRGRMFAVQIGNHACWFFPTFDPTFIRHQAYDDAKPLNSRYGHAYRMDMRRVFDLADELGEPNIITPVEAKKDILTFNGAGGSSEFDKVIEEFERAIKSKKIALDLETYPLRPYSTDAAVLTASISYHFKAKDKKKKVRTFAFAIDHPQAKWSKKQRDRLVYAFKELMAQKGNIKIAHNAPFELEWLMFLFGGIDWVDHNSWEDTMMQAHLLDERKGPGKEEDNRPAYQKLDFLIRQYFGLALKSMFKLNKKDMRKTDIDECLLYNGCDSKHTLFLHDHQEQLLINDDIQRTFEMSKPRQTTVALMQSFGVDVDQKANKRWKTKLQGEVDEIEKQIRELKVVKQFVKDKGSFNPQSTADVLTIFKDYLKRDEIRVAGKRAGDAERLAVDKGVLERIDHPLAPAIVKLRNRSKLKSTYVDEFTLGTGSIIYPDGKLHTSYNTTFTTSGRLSSDGPNLQNFPKREDKEVREQVVPPKGHIILAIDYGQLEWCLACICSRDKAMIDATWKGYDVHMEWAGKIAKLWPQLVGGKKYLGDPAKMKKARGLVKNKMVFPVIFGATQESVAGYLNMPEGVAKDIFKEFWATFKGLDTWQRQLMKNYYEVGYVENLFGRRRRYPMTKNEAINHPIQSTASDMVVDAMTRLSMLALETGEMHLHPRLNIHDDLTFFVPDDEKVIDEAMTVIVSEMLKVPYDFINVPMSVEVSIGKNWSELEDICKFWTTDLYGKKHEDHHWSKKRGR